MRFCWKSYCAIEYVIWGTFFEQILRNNGKWYILITILYCSANWSQCKPRSVKCYFYYMGVNTSYRREICRWIRHEARHSNLIWIKYSIVFGRFRINWTVGSIHQFRVFTLFFLSAGPPLLLSAWQWWSSLYFDTLEGRLTTPVHFH